MARNWIMVLAVFLTCFAIWLPLWLASVHGAFFFALGANLFMPEVEYFVTKQIPTPESRRASRLKGIFFLLVGVVFAIWRIGKGWP